MARWSSSLAEWLLLRTQAREPFEIAQDEARLRRAEKDIRWLRNVGMVGWFVVLHGHGYEFGLTPVWAAYAVGVIACVYAHVQASRAVDIRRAAVITTFLDPLLAATICMVTGGIESMLYPFFYFTQISVAIRFGVIESVGVACFNVGLTLLLYFVEPLYSGHARTSMLSLCTTLFQLMFSGYLGAILAEWAREHADLITQHARTLREAGERYQAFLRRFAQAQEEERHNIAGELHDRMSGHLFSLRIGIEHCMRDDLSRDQLQERLHGLAATVNACTRDVRSIMNELRPTVLDELGFYEAASEFLMRQAEISPYRLVYRIDPSLKDWRSKQDAMLFRLLQEALLNVQKHAHASNVEVSLAARGSAVELCIADDGSGFDPQKIPIGHYGLMTMRERAEAAGGVLSIESGGKRRGTRVCARMPRLAA